MPLTERGGVLRTLPSCFSSTLSSSSIAAGSITCKRATRSSASLRTGSGILTSTWADCSSSSEASTMAMICGCSSSSSSATAPGSIHFSASMPEVCCLPGITFASMERALLSPSALVSTRRVNSEAPSPSGLSALASSWNAASTVSTCSLEIDDSDAMASPMRCTSRGSM